MSKLRRVPRAAWLCGAVAALNLVAWSLLTPPFQVPDEIAHFAYVQRLAETGRPPVSRSTTRYSPEEQAALERLYFFAVIGQPRTFPTATRGEEEALDHALATARGRRGNGDASVATSQPPLYYALASVPYAIGTSGSILTRLALIRLLSCLLGVLTVMFCFGFLRETFPSTPWAWSVGALAVAFQPLFSFVSSGVNPDALLFCAAAGLFWALARAFQRGLTPLNGAAIGAATVVGLLGKLTFLGLVPGAALGVLWLLWRDHRRAAQPALAGATTALAITVVPFAAYVALNVSVWNRSALGGAEIASLARPGVGTGGGGRSLSGLASYVWQLYLPRLPSMRPWFSALPLREIWLHGFIGRFGWLDYGFPGWVYTAALFVAAVVVIAAMIALVQARASLRRRVWEIATYLVMAAGLLFAIGRSGYQARTGGQPQFEQARYLLPLLAPYAALIALAARAGGRRWGPAFGALLIVLAAAHNIFAGLLTFTRYYG
jgi:4-amino-4-deoxy-L-arabinose transferase-like glycosyltransferase